nr:glycosyltransferase family A protein [uncultured Flavobacterium sp.]
MDKNNLVSIIVPCYNQAQYLSDALHSVLEQTYTNWECIIVDDGSPDNTVEIAKKWIDQDDRFKYIFKENGGLSSARNAGITQSKGQFILPLDADDRIGKNYLEFAVEAFQQDSTLKVVYCKAQKFGSETGEWYLRPFSLENLAKFNMIFCSAFFKKTDWELIGGYDSNMKHGLEDWEFWTSLLKNGGNVKQMDFIGFYYRVKSGSMLDNLSIALEKEMLNYMSIKHAAFYVEYLGSFTKLFLEKQQIESQYRRQLKSKKYVLNLFLSTFFNFKIYKNI